MGTSATLGSSEGDAARLLREFAGQVFGQSFDEESVITEERLTPGEFFEGDATREELPYVTDELEPRDGECPEDYRRRLTWIWLPVPTTLTCQRRTELLKPAGIW